MSRQNANVDIVGTLRVRKRVNENLRVQKEVEASAFYIRGVGEIGTITFRDGTRTQSAVALTFSGSDFYLSKDSSGRPEVNLRSTGGGLASVTFKDGLSTQADDTLNFSGRDFYLSKDSLGNPSLNFKGGVTFQDGRISQLSDAVNFNPNHFYLTKTTSGKPSINLSPLSGDNTSLVAVPVVLTTSGTTREVDGLPTNLKRIVINFNEVSISTNNFFEVQLGNNASGYTTTGYQASCAQISSGGAGFQASTSGFLIYTITGSQTARFSGQMTLTRPNQPNGTGWVASVVGSVGDGSSASHTIVGGGVVVTGSLNKLRLIPQSGSGASFDNGSFSVFYEY